MSQSIFIMPPHMAGQHLIGVMLLIVMCCLIYLVVAEEHGLPFRKFIKEIFIGWFPCWLIILPSIIIAFCLILN